LTLNGATVCPPAFFGEPEIVANHGAGATALGMVTPILELAFDNVRIANWDNTSQALFAIVRIATGSARMIDVVQVS
jgi:hypothetical protein